MSRDVGRKRNCMGLDFARLQKNDDRVTRTAWALKVGRYRAAWRLKVGRGPAATPRLKVGDPQETLQLYYCTPTL